MTSSSDVPFEVRIWNAAQCAEYLGHTREHFLRKIRYELGFPKPLPMSEHARPRWQAKAVTDWALDRRIPETTTRAGSKK